MNNHKSYAIFAFSIVLLVVTFFTYQSVVYKTEVSDFDLSASIADSAGVAPNSHFILKTTEPLTAQVVEKYIKTTPKVNLSIKKISAEENTFEIIPEEELLPNQIYTIQIDKGPLASHDFSWAYQIKAPFQVISSVPGNEGVEVPTNTGIEINFNRDTVIDPLKFIDISPKISGEFQVYEGGVRFIPRTPLDEKTIYTINIKSGLQAKDTTDTFLNDKIIQFQTGQNYSQNREPLAFFSRSFTEFRPGSDIMLGVSSYGGASSVSATVYRFDSAQEFIDSVKEVRGDVSWARYYTNIDANLPLTKKVFSAGIPLETWSYASYIKMPQTLRTGYYAAVINSGKNKDISWFQVNPAASFVSFSSLKSLVWLKDIATEKSLNGIPFVYDNKRIAETGVDGVALFDTPKNLIRKPTDSYYTNERRFLIAQIPTGDLVIPVESEYGGSILLNPNDGWWDYISLNKNVYLPTDTLRFWAIGKPRAHNTSAEEISVKLTTTYWTENQENIVTYGETKLKVSDYSTVTGEISFANLRPGNYDLTFRKGDETIAKQNVTVSAYVKPAYKITVTPDKNTMFAGHTVTFKVKTEFFDGTPVANTALSYSAYSNKNYQGTFVLDSKGEGSFSITPEYNFTQTYFPAYLSVNIKPEKSEEAQIETNAFVYVFGPRVYNSISQKQSASDVAFTIKTRSVVIYTGFRTEPYWDTESYLGGSVPNISTKVEIAEVVYLKDKTGTGYDPINKVTYPIYNYRTEDRPISSQVVSADQGGIAQLSFATQKEKTYKFTFTTYDNTERAVVDTRYVYGGLGDVNYLGIQDSYYYLIDSDKKTDNYKIGESVNLELQTYQGVIPPLGQGNYIFIAANNGNLSYEITDSGKFNRTFKNEDVPNIGVWPGWFAQGRFHSSYLKNISFDANEKRLRIAITKDKQTYNPGDDVTLDLRVTDKNNNPVKAEVNLSALDEAVFSIRPEEKDIVNDLYKDTYSQVVIRTSNMPPYGGGGAEKGGGEGEGVRSNIKEMAVFKTVTTDSNGTGRVQFKLPDNITSWRITSQAVTKDLYAGKSVDFVPVTLPLFVDGTLNKTYLTGDEVILRLRAFGTALGKGNTNYTVESATLPFKKIEKVDGDSTEIPLGALIRGNHELTMTVKNGGLSDALIRPIHVLNSYFTKNTSDFYEGVSGLKITNNSAFHTTLTFSSLGRGRLYNTLKQLSYGWGVRLDQKGTGLVATNLLNTYFGEKNEIPELQASKYQAYTGGMQLLPYSSEDLELSAIGAHIFGEVAFDKTLLRDYLTKSLSDSKSDPSRITRALYGLSAFDEPVLTKIQKIKNDPSLTIKDQVFVGLALDAIGSKEEARAYYKKLIKPSLEIKPSYAYVNGLSFDDTIVTTALLAVLTARLGEPESIKLARYTDENFPRETLSNFERLLYVTSVLPTLSSEEVSFAYKTLSKNGDKTLKDGESFNLTLSKEEMASFELTDIKGKLGVTASYEQESTPQSIVKDKNLSLNRVYEVNSVVTKQFKEGDTVLIRLNPQFTSNALDGYYQITDYVPSGLRPVDQEGVRYEYYGRYGARIFPTEINDQKVTFLVSKNETLPVYYYARVVSKGVYKAEPALLQSLRSLESATISNEDSITIK